LLIDWTVPPVYYADQACERAKLHVREQENGEQVLGQVHKDLKYAMVCAMMIYFVILLLDYSGGQRIGDG
jgi:hypothetical protein